MQERVDITIENQIAHVRMVRSDKMNALDNDMMKALIAAGERLKDEAGLRAIVLSGEGRAFCAGLDMGNFSATADKADSDEKLTRKPLVERTHGQANMPQKVACIWREIGVPVIAAAHGFTLGGGFQIFMGADIRFAAPGTKFSIMEIKWGLVPDMGTTHVMARLAREDILKELAMTGRIFEADEALDIGFLTRIHDDPVAHALDVAQQIAARNPEAIRGIKRLYNEPADRHLRETLILESEIQDEIIGGPNQIEAVMAEMEKREARFDDVASAAE